MSQRDGNWGRSGEADERGLLSLPAPEAVHGAAERDRGRIVSLILPLSTRETPTLRPRPLRMMTVDGGHYEAGAPQGPNGFKFADDYVGMAGHTGTHIEALSHAALDGVMNNRFPATEARSRTGTRRLSIERFGGLVGGALLLDVARSVCLAGPPVDFEIGIDHLQAALEVAGAVIRAGDGILLCTGWPERFVDDDLGGCHAELGTGVVAGRWLSERDVVMIGAHKWLVELAPSLSGDTMPVQLICLREYGIHLMELVNLVPVVDAGAIECVLIVAPLPIRGVGSPVNLIAVR